ncbi:MAG: choice-of-anchor Q domain-containing protein [Omnitrophica WOR_2 bacterium]
MNPSAKTAFAAPRTNGPILTVNSTLDAPDADTGDGICATASGTCTLRAAIMQANVLPETASIVLPAGIYLLTRVGYDDNSFAGSLDITNNMNIFGAGSGVSIIDGNGPVTKDRVFQVLGNASAVYISGITIRNGYRMAGSNPVGGGFSLLGRENDPGFPSLHLTDVVIYGNTAGNAGGMYSYYGSVVLRNSSIWGNTAYNSGGGYFAQNSILSIQDSKIFSNTANNGGGLTLYNIDFGRFERSEIYSNTVTTGGGGLFITAEKTHPASLVTLQDSSVHNNHANTGAGIEANSSLVISHTVIDANAASLYGGGLRINPNLFVRKTLVARSTLSHNTAQYGAGIYADETVLSNGDITLENSSLSGNSASHEGGGVYAAGMHARISLQNATIADNQVFRPLPYHYPAFGGGLVITATAVISAQNSLIGNNIFTTGSIVSTPDNCFGPLNSLGNNLIETTSHCTVGGTTTGNITGQDPLLGPLQNNGGWTPTQALLAGSPAIDAGTNTNCPANDQRGVKRPFNTICDIGAYEAASQVSQTISFQGIPDLTMRDSPFTVIASASSGLMVSFTSNTPGICRVNRSSLFAGTTSALVTLVKVGSCTIVARQSGNSTFNPAADVPETFKVSAGLQIYLPIIRH